jgi:hypothetical protein
MNKTPISSELMSQEASVELKSEESLVQSKPLEQQQNLETSITSEPSDNVILPAAKIFTTAVAEDNNVKGIIHAVDSITSRIAGVQMDVNIDSKDHIIKNVEHIASSFSKDKDILHIKNNITQLLNKFGVKIEEEKKSPSNIEVLPDSKNVPLIRKREVIKDNENKENIKDVKRDKLREFLLNLLVLVYVLVQTKIIPMAKIQAKNMGKEMVKQILLYMMIRNIEKKIFE